MGLVYKQYTDYLFPNSNIQVQLFGDGYTVLAEGTLEDPDNHDGSTSMQESARWGGSGTDVYGLTDLDESASSVQNVKVYAALRGQNSDGGHYRLGVYIGSTIYWAHAEQTTPESTETFTWCSLDLGATSPATGIAWTVSEVNDMGFVMFLASGTGKYDHSYATALYVEVAATKVYYSLSTARHIITGGLSIKDIARHIVTGGLITLDTARRILLAHKLVQETCSENLTISRTQNITLYLLVTCLDALTTSVPATAGKIVSSIAEETMGISGPTNKLAHMLTELASLTQLQANADRLFTTDALVQSNLTVADINIALGTLRAVISDAMQIDSINITSAALHGQATANININALMDYWSELSAIASDSINIGSTTAFLLTLSAIASGTLSLSGLSDGERISLLASVCEELIAFSETQVVSFTATKQLIELINMSAVAASGNALYDTLAENLNLGDSLTEWKIINTVLLASIALNAETPVNITYELDLEETVSLVDLLSSIKTFASTCADTIGITDVSFHVTARGNVTITFYMRSGQIDYTLKKGQIDFALKHGQIITEM